ncbi:fimbrial protein [Serratia sp. S1B]|nr:fimbrial protein [Serratia sp. S1B]
MKTLLTPWVLILLLSQTTAAIAALPDASHDIFSPLPVDRQCALSISTPVVDYGSQSRWQLQETAGGNGVTPGKRMLMLSVICPYSQTMRLALHGNRAANGDLRYGNHGKVTIHLQEAQLDGQNVQLANITPNGTFTAVRDSLDLQPGSNFGVIQNGQLAKGKNLTVRIELEPEMTKNSVGVSQRQNNEATFTLELMN